jgi:hypothetical protein
MNPGATVIEASVWITATATDLIGCTGASPEGAHLEAQSSPNNHTDTTSGHYYFGARSGARPR